MALLDFLKEIQVLSAQDKPYGAALMENRLQEKKAQRMQAAEMQRGQALAQQFAQRGDPQSMQIAQLLSQGVPLSDVSSYLKATSPAAGKLTFDAFGNPIQVVMGADGMPVAQKIGGLEYQGGGLRNVLDKISGISGWQQAQPSQPVQPEIGLDTPLGMDSEITPETDAIMRMDYSQQPEAPNYDAQIDRLMQVRQAIALEPVGKAESPQQQAAINQIDTQIKMIQEKQGKVTSEGETAFDRSTKLRQQFEKNTQPILDKLADYESAVKLASLGTGSADIALIKLGVQAYDKRASAVTDDEFAQQARAGAFGDKIKSQIMQATSGERLTPAIRKQIVESIAANADTGARNIQEAIDAFAPRFEKFGLDVKSELPEYITRLDSFRQLREAPLPTTIRPKRYNLETGKFE